MKVVILCGGLGTRLREETEFRPKPMVEIGNKPILWHIMKIYSRYGIREFVLCLGYKGEIIKDYFLNYELLNNDFTIQLGNKKSIEVHSNHHFEEFEWKLTLADTGDKTLKGARLKLIEKYIDGDIFMVTYGDSLCNVDIIRLIEFHKSHGKIGTVTGINIGSRFGELKIKDNSVESFNEKPKNGSEFINGGFFVFNKKIFDYLTTDEFCDFEIGPLEKLAKENQLMVYKHSGFWACMDNIRDMEYLNNLWDTNKADWKVWQ